MISDQQSVFSIRGAARKIRELKRMETEGTEETETAVNLLRHEI